MKQIDKQHLYWRKSLRVTALLLLVWFAITLGTGFFARELNEYRFLGFPLGFYMGAQGALLLYLMIVWFYAKYMDRVDEAHDIGNHEGS